MPAVKSDFGISAGFYNTKNKPQRKTEKKKRYKYSLGRLRQFISQPKAEFFRTEGIHMIGLIP